jgi:biotin carboxylase
MKKLLIIGAGILQVAVIRRAQEMGYCTIAVDSNKNAPGIEIANKAIIADITDIETILKYAKEEKIDGVIHPCSEVAMNTMGRINEEMSLSGIDLKTAIKSTNKVKMRRAFEVANISSPISKEVNKEEDAIQIVRKIIGGVVLKPSRNSGSRGVSYLESDATNNDILTAYKHAIENSYDKSALIEQYIDGPECSVEIVIWNNEPKVLTVTDKLTSENSYFVELGHSQPSQFSKKEITDIKHLAIAGCKALGLNWCVAHAEIKIQDEKPYIIEIGARLGGDFISTELVHLSTGIDMVAAAIDLAFGKIPDLTSRHSIQGAAIRYFTPTPGMLTKLIVKDDINKPNQIYQFEIYKKTGEIIPELKSSLDRSGHVITIGKDAKEAINNAEMALRSIEYETELA